MSLAALAAIAKPPIDVTPISRNRWLSIEQALGTSLPEDYQQYVDAFGLAVLGRFEPYAPNDFLPALDLRQATEEILQGYRDLLPGEDPPIDCTLFPEKGGLLPWGHTTQGRDLFWLTEGDPDGWEVAVASGFPDLEIIRYPLAMTDFMAGVLSGRIHCPLIDPLDPPDAIPVTHIRP